MKSKIVFLIVIVLMILPLWSCSGNKPASEIIVVTGRETSTPTKHVESDESPVATQESQFTAETTAPSPTNAPETTACQTFTVTIKSSNAYLRDGPDLRFVTIAPYKKGDEFKLVSHYKDWFQVESSDGNTGWLYKEWLSLPSDFDTRNICTISEDAVPTLTSHTPKPSRDDDNGECVPSYYDSCD